ncbi:hypothetical protein QAD02_022027 [Eretmocerus hayati]|uniref:Uncharacterized protein n=1 Tax=Eretmocerus hayati TaxID=131215 RepID=A0ACC2PTC1_9HYME|nr:hypothetical protein QAD02_022027 [Eretmocerus hayati]
MDKVKIKSVQGVKMNLKRFHQLPVQSVKRKRNRKNKQTIDLVAAENFRPSKLRKYSEWKMDPMRRLMNTRNLDNYDEQDFSDNVSQIRSTTEIEEGNDEIEVLKVIIKEPLQRPAKLIAALGGIDSDKSHYRSDANYKIIAPENQIEQLRKEMEIKETCQGSVLLWGHRISWSPKPLPPPAAGVITGVRPWEPLVFPRTPAGIHAIHCLLEGTYTVVSTIKNSTRIVEAGGIVMISPGRITWKCANCYKESYMDEARWKGWFAHRIHVICLETAISGMECTCGRTAYRMCPLST